MRSIAEEFDLLLVDLDGTIYLGGQVIPHAADSLNKAAELGTRSIFVTNNASRPPADVAESLAGMGLKAAAEDVLTSPEAAAKMLAESHPSGSPVLIIGAAALADAVANVGLRPVRLASDQPVALVQGHSPDTGWRDLAEGCIALRAGVDWVACNTDTTLPTDRGLLPGNGSMVQALVTATGLRPRVAGKPNRPLLDEGVRRAGAQRPLVIGDRLDTDIQAAATAGMPSLLVLSGVSTAADLLAAVEAERPTYIAFDLRGVIDPSKALAVGGEPDGWLAKDVDGSLVLSRDAPAPDGDQPPDLDILTALAVLARVAWASPDGPSGNPRGVKGSDDWSNRALDRLGLLS